MVVDRVVAGKMVESQILMDGLSMMRQLGNHQVRQILAALGISDREPLQAQSSVKNGHLVTK